GRRAYGHRGEQLQIVPVGNQRIDLNRRSLYLHRLRITRPKCGGEEQIVNARERVLALVGDPSVYGIAGLIALQSLDRIPIADAAVRLAVEVGGSPEAARPSNQVHAWGAVLGYVGFDVELIPFRAEAKRLANLA